MIKNKKNLIINIILILSISFCIVFIARYFILKKEQNLLNEKYITLTNNLKDKTNSLIQAKKNATLAIALTLAQNDKIKEFFISQDKDYRYDLNELSEKLRDSTDYKNVWFQVINKDGISLYRSWTQNKNDKIKNFRLDLQEMFLNPKIKSTISVGIYDITFKSIIPIYQENNFLGILEVITHFNSISKDIEKTDEVESIVLVDKKFTNQLKEKSFTKIFLKDFYVANLSVTKNLLDYLQEKDLDKLLEINSYKIEDNRVITSIPILQDNIKLANILVFKDLSKIDTKEIEEFKKHAFLYLGFFLIFLFLLVFIISYYFYSKRLKELNNILQQTVNSEVSKNNEKNKLLFQQNKMAAMGEMIENIAHQWRQPLSIITTAASSIKLKKEFGILEDKEYNECLEHIIDTANYLSNTVDDFRYYFTPNKNKNKFYTQELINKSIKLVSVSFNEKNIKIVKNIENFEIFTFENELLQTIINILNNAKDELIKKEENEIKLVFINLFKNENNLIIEIKDNADGIKEEIIDRIFEPYFTTKHKSKGTGIGLYMCEEIIVKHIKGKIEVYNETYEYEEKAFKGAVFKIFVPLD